MARTGRVYVNQSVSFPPEMLAAARKRARGLRLSFSAYVQRCVERDLADGGAMVFQETQEAQRLVADDPAPEAGPKGKHPKK